MSNFLSRLAADGLVDEGPMLHGLRVTYAAGIKRKQVMATLGRSCAR
jgi:hypothetical protein